MRAPPFSKLTWTASVDRQALRDAGHDVIEFSQLCREVVAPARHRSARRESLANPARDWLSRVAHAEKLAIVGVRIEDLDDLASLHGYVLEPALRCGARVVIESEQRLTRLPPERFVDPQFEYPYTLERALEVAMRLHRGAGTPPDALTRAPSAGPLDAEQRRAVQAHDGVVQVIAPAGSGKTAVLISRVRELLSRGVPPQRILCTTFNRDARGELRERLGAAGLGSVIARTFHSVGLWLMREERLARSGGVRELTLSQWKRLCALAYREEGTWIELANARAGISAIKLGLLRTPREFRREAGKHTDGAALAGKHTDAPALARVYELYEEQLTEQAINDFDDLVLVAVRALREDDELRRRWQSRFAHVLVDEYQDIEPAQELLVRILAAPQDGFFCVGDEDQTLYGWRRASVRRIIDLDQAYPGLQRISLAHNYRCPPEIVDASRRLIEHNQIRFPKPIGADPGRSPSGSQALALHEHEGQQQAADEIARVLAARRRAEIVVLARTTNLLRTVALACAGLGVRISAPEAVFEPHGARGALEAYVRLCGHPDRAQPEDVALVCRRPSRGLPFETEERVAELLRGGLRFAESFARLPANPSQRARLDDAGRILDALARITDARRFIAYLRGPGGLDDYFAEQERTFGGAEQIELEVLEQAQREASNRTVAEYGALLQSRRDALRAIRDDVHGIELTTIHRAKGRQWPEVQLFACEERQLPHHRSLEASADERAAGEGIEAERRLAYVAFTRAQQTLVVYATGSAASRFLSEAGLAPSSPYEPPAVKARRGGKGSRGGNGSRKDRAASRRERKAARESKDAGEGKADSRELANPTRGDPRAAGVAEARRVGLGYALRTASSREAARDLAAAAIEQRIVGPQTASDRMSVVEMLEAIEQLNDSERTTVADAAGIGDGATLVVRLDAKRRAGLVRALRKENDPSDGFRPA